MSKYFIDPPHGNEVTDTLAGVPPLPHLSGDTGNDERLQEVSLFRYVLAGIVSLSTFLGVFVGFASVMSKLTYNSPSISSFVALFLMVSGVVPAWFVARAVGRVITGKGSHHRHFKQRK